MRPPAMLIVALCVTQLPVSSANLPGPLYTTYTLARGIAHDIHGSWRNFYDRAGSRRRHTLIRRAQPLPGKCQLRLIGPLNATSPTSSRHSSTSSTLSTSGTLSISGNLSTQRTPTTTSSSQVKTTSTSTGTTYPTSIFSLKQVHNGSSFFDGWDFYSYADPTQGNVNYLSRADAWNSQLVSINSAGHAIMKVDTTPVVSGNRNSVRINFSNSFNGGLLTADIYHMPVGCGAWPAWWTGGPDWPTYGEIDILEGVHVSVQNQVSLHTAPGCKLASTSGFSGSVVNGQNCGSTTDTNTGCGILAWDKASYGEPFNSGGGGVYAMLWDNSGIRIWLFHRGNTPADLTRDAPLPETWGQPMATFGSSTCNPWQYMQNHVAIFDTTLCGTWAGSAWAGSGCPASTGYSACTAYVQNQGGAFANAYWEVASVKLYQ